MDNVETGIVEDSSSTEIVPERTQEKLSIRDALDKAFEEADKKAAEEEDDTPEADEEEDKAEEVEAAPVEAKPERIPVVPPADMNKAEKEAFLNPTPENAYILQQYMNRRAYETRTDYQRKMQEVEQLKSQTSGIYDTIKQYENDYAREGISIGDIAKRSIAWDKAMKSNPIQTAIEWLDSYGVNLNDLASYQPQDGYQPQQPQGQYLTREEAERIAEEKLQAAQAEQQKNAVAYYNERIVESFVAAKPLFKDPETASQLEAEMAPIVSALTSTGKYSSPEEILETAYNYVVAGNPTFSSLNQAMTARPAIEQKQAAVQKAKAASRSISGSAGSGTPRMQIKDIRDNLRRRMSGE
jgi:hypothetical protein